MYEQFHRSMTKDYVFMGLMRMMMTSLAHLAERRVSSRIPKNNTETLQITILIDEGMIDSDFDSTKVDFHGPAPSRKKGAVNLLDNVFSSS